MKRFPPAMATLLACSVALADGRLEGRVSQSGSSAMVEGALVRLPALGLAAATRADGRYQFPQVPVGAHRLTVRYLGYAPYRTTIDVREGQTTTSDVVLGGAIEEIVVYGRQSASTASALSQQRASDRITSVVPAEEIGALPDQNA